MQKFKVTYQGLNQSNVLQMPHDLSFIQEKGSYITVKCLVLSF